MACVGCSSGHNCVGSWIFSGEQHSGQIAISTMALSRRTTSLCCSVGCRLVSYCVIVWNFGAVSRPYSGGLHRADRRSKFPHGLRARTRAHRIHMSILIHISIYVHLSFAWPHSHKFASAPACGIRNAISIQLYRAPTSTTASTSMSISHPTS